MMHLLLDVFDLRCCGAARSIKTLGTRKTPSQPGDSFG